MRRKTSFAMVSLLATAGFLGSLANAQGPQAPPDPVVQTARTDCRLRFSMKGWSAFYKRAKGRGVITCDNGQSRRVRISVRGGGLTFGRSQISDGSGRFSEVRSIDELFGSYASASAHAGAGPAAQANVLTKGTVSLAISGRGTGVDVGIDMSSFTIEPDVG